MFLIIRDGAKRLRRGLYYLAINEDVFYDLFEEAIGELLLDNQRVRLLVFARHTEEIHVDGHRDHLPRVD